MQEIKKSYSVLGYIGTTFSYIFKALISVIRFIFKTPVFLWFYAVNLFRIFIITFLGFSFLGIALRSFGLGNFVDSFEKFIDGIPHSTDIFIVLFFIFVAHFTYTQLRGDLD